VRLTLEGQPHPFIISTDAASHPTRKFADISIKIK
jgi:hypothetical protein